MWGITAGRKSCRREGELWGGGELWEGGRIV